jgi:hypothetical protein
MVSRSLLTAEAWVQSQANTLIYEICDIQSGNGTEIFQVLRCSSLITVPQMPHINSTISDTIQSWQLTLSLSNTPQKKFKIGYLAKRGGKEERHAIANLAHLLARISKVMFYRNKEIPRKAKCIMVVTGLFFFGHKFFLE